MYTAEELRSIYNDRYSSTGDKDDRWSLTDPGAASRVAKWVAAMADLRPGARVLDVGCAKGFVSKALFDEGFSVVGLDISEVAIAKATMKHPGPDFRVHDGFHPCFNERFDLILMRGFSGTNSAELPSVAGILRRYLDYLTQTGCIVVQVPVSKTFRASDDWQPWSWGFIQQLSMACSVTVAAVKYGDPATSVVKDTFRKLRFALTGKPVNASILLRRCPCGFVQV